MLNKEIFGKLTAPAALTKYGHFSNPGFGYFAIHISFDEVGKQISFLVSGYIPKE